MRSKVTRAGFLLGFLLIASVLNAQSGEPTAGPIELPLSVSVNKGLVVRLPKPAIRVAVTQPQIAEAVVLAPDLIIVNGKSVGSTTLLVWFEETVRPSP